ncbi:MAG: serpin family protein, partial [Nanoarchaeota archaeon]
MVTKKTILSSIMLVFVLFIVGCSEPPQLADDTGYSDEGLAAVVYANNEFAFDMYDEINAGKNLFFSPYSVQAAFAMAYDGSAGETEAEIGEVFHFPDKGTLHPNFARVYNLLNMNHKDYTLRSANALWTDSNYPFLETFISDSAKYYASEANNLDFGGNPEAARNTINDWVEKKTENRIKELLGPGSISPLTALVITNAVYFKGDWVLKFDKGKTQDSDFYIDEETVVQVPMMALTGEKARFNYL